MVGTVVRGAGQLHLELVPLQVHGDRDALVRPQGAALTVGGPMDGLRRDGVVHIAVRVGIGIAGVMELALGFGRHGDVGLLPSGAVMGVAEAAETDA